MSTFHPLHPSTHHVSTHPIPSSEATTFLQTFIHWTSSTRPIRNRKHPYNSLPVVPFPHSVLNNLRRIEMGLRGEQAPRLKPNRTPAVAPKKRKWAEENVLVSGEVAAEDAIVAANEDEGSEGEEMEVQMGGREMRMDGEMVPEAPRVLMTATGGDVKKGKGKEDRKKEKKARRKEEKRVREEKRRKGGDEEEEGGEDEE